MGFFSGLVTFVSSFARDVSGVVFGFLGIEFEAPVDAVTGIEVNQNSNIKKRPIIYGIRRIGGVRVFIGVSGTDNEYLHIALDVCEGEISDIEVLINDKLATTYSGAVLDEEIHVGSDTQSADALLVSEFTDWTTAHQLKGVAYVHDRFIYDRDVWVTGIPNIKALVRGMKVLNVATSVTEYTTDPASCIYDYCINTLYGRGIPAADLNLVSFQEAKTYYAEQVETFPASGVFINRFEMNIILDTGKTVAENLRSMLATVRSHLTWINGQYYLKPLKGGSSVFSFSEDNIIGGVSFTNPGKKAKLNRVKVAFTNPTKNWQTDYVIDESATFLAEDNGVQLSAEIMLPGETNYYRAKHYAETILKESREAIQCEIKSYLGAWKIVAGDIVDVSYASYGWVNKPFRAWGVTLAGDGMVSVALKEHENSVFDYAVTSEEPTPPDTVLPDPFTVVTPTLTLASDTTVNTDGSIVPRIKATWVDPTDGYTDYYVLQYKKTGDSSWTSLNISRSDEHYITGVKIGVQYQVRLKSVNTYGVSSAFDTETNTPGGDTTAPGLASSLSATTALKGIALKWTNPSDKDFDHVDIYRYTTDTQGSATVIASVKTNSYADTNVTSGQDYYYWLKTVDTTFNASAFFPATNGVDAKTSEVINIVSAPRVDLVSFTT